MKDEEYAKKQTEDYSLDEQIVSKSTALNDVDCKIARLQGHLYELVSQIKEQKSCVSQLLSLKDELEPNIASLTVKYSDAVSVLETLRSDFAQVETENHQFDDQLSMASQLNTQLESEVNQLMKELEEVQSHDCEYLSYSQEVCRLLEPGDICLP